MIPNGRREASSSSLEGSRTGVMRKQPQCSSYSRRILFAQVKSIYVLDFHREGTERSVRAGFAPQSVIPRFSNLIPSNALVSLKQWWTFHRSQSGLYCMAPSAHGLRGGSCVASFILSLHFPQRMSSRDTSDKTVADIPSYEEAAVNICAPIEVTSPLGYHVICHLPCTPLERVPSFSHQ